MGHKASMADSPVKNLENTADDEGISFRETSLATSSLVTDAVFRGSYHHSLDDKGRVSVPASFRLVLGRSRQAEVVITNFICEGARCLEGFSLDAWRKFEANLAQRSRFDPQVKKLENYYLARAVVCPLDASGRINIPQQLRSYAGFEKDIVFTASIHGFRIWDTRVWELVFQEAETQLLENPALFMDVDT